MNWNDLASASAKIKKKKDAAFLMKRPILRRVPSFMRCRERGSTIATSVIATWPCADRTLETGGGCIDSLSYASFKSGLRQMIISACAQGQPCLTISRSESQAVTFSDILSFFSFFFFFIRK